MATNGGRRLSRTVLIVAAITVGTTGCASLTQMNRMEKWADETCEWQKNFRASYAHFYYCDVEVHKNPAECQKLSDHIAPPPPPPPPR